MVRWTGTTAPFTIPHFDGYSAILIQLPEVSAQALCDAITDGWLACAPSALAQQLDRQDVNPDR